ncbi:MAG: hypothetical protein IT285_09615 [Bdellovibrionales bacterium]|nr:hypothetical protein [Bdellovibrionales bacterium]
MTWASLLFLLLAVGAQAEGYERWDCRPESRMAEYQPLCGRLRALEQSSGIASAARLETAPNGTSCQRSEHELGVYSYCAVASYGGTPDVELMLESVIPRTARRVGGSAVLPGQYVHARAEANGDRMRKHWIRARNNEASLERTALLQARSRDAYLTQVLAPALQQEHQALAALSVSAAVPSATTPDQVAPAAPFDSLGRKLETARTEGPTALWKELRRLRQAEEASDAFTEKELNELRALRAKYLGPEGTWASGVLPDPVSSLADGLAERLKTEPHSPEGREIRSRLNQGLAVAADGSSTLHQQQEALGALTLVVGADLAYAEAEPAAGQSLLHAGAEALDLGLGLLPVAGTVNDAAQILHGMATGHDYAGNPMAAGDYALRGFGIVLGLLPGGSAGVKLGGQLVQRSFASGARLIREAELGRRLVAGLGKLKGSVVEIVGGIGDLFGRAHPLRRIPELKQFADVLPRTRVIKVESAEEANRFWAESGIIDPYLKGTRTFVVELAEEAVAHRASTIPEAAKGQWLTLSDPTLVSKTEYRELMALPDPALPGYLTTLRLRPGSFVRIGVVGPQAGVNGVQLSGGGIQLDLMRRAFDEGWGAVMPWN